MSYSDTKVDFENDIEPLFRAWDIEEMKKISISSERGTEPLQLDDYECVKKYHSRILTRLRGRNDDGQPVKFMPLGRQWPDAKISLFEQWIADGLLKK